MEGPPLPPEARTPAQVWNLIEREFFLKRSLTLRAVEDRRKQQRGELKEEHLRKNPQARFYFDSHADAKLEIKLIDEQCHSSLASCRAIWKNQGRSEGRVFFDAVRDFCLFPLMAKGTSDLIGELESLEKNTNRPGLLSSSKAFFERELERLRSDWRTRLEIAVIESEHQRRRVVDAFKTQCFIESSKSAETTLTPLKQKRTPRAKPPCVAEAVKIIAKNPRITPTEFCKAIDGKAQSHPSQEKYKPPTRWEVKTFFDQYYKRPNTVSRFLTSARTLASQSNRQS